MPQARNEPLRLNQKCLSRRGWSGLNLGTLRRDGGLFFWRRRWSRGRFGCLGLCEFQNDHRRGVAMASSGLDDTGVAAVPVYKSWRNRRKEAGDNRRVEQECSNLAPRVEIASFPEGNHLVCNGTHLFGLRFCGLNPLDSKKRGDEISQQGPPMRGVTSQWTAGYMMSHVCLRFSCRGQAPPGGAPLLFRPSTSDHSFS